MIPKIFFKPTCRQARKSPAWPERGRRGFTLLEILIAAFIFLSMTIVVLAILQAITKTRSKTSILMDIQTQGFWAMEIMTNEARNANKNAADLAVIPIPYSGFAITDQNGVLNSTEANGLYDGVGLLTAY